MTSVSLSHKSTDLISRRMLPWKQKVHVGFKLDPFNLFFFLIFLRQRVHKKKKEKPKVISDTKTNMSFQTPTFNLELGLV